MTATRPAEMLTMDIVHMPEASGYKYLLTVVDVFTKYGAAVPLTEITATAVLTPAEVPAEVAPVKLLVDKAA